MKIDSGAIDTVMPPNMAVGFTVHQTDQSVNRPGFRAANGTSIKHHGEKRIEGWNDDFQPLAMIAQVADVKTTLGSVHQIDAQSRQHGSLREGQLLHPEQVDWSEDRDRGEERHLRGRSLGKESSEGAAG